jgi:internalin A
LAENSNSSNTNKRDPYSIVLNEIEEALKNRNIELNLSYLGLIELPERLFELTQLQTLHLDNNQLTELPERIGDLVQLQTLNLDRNQLTQLPERIGDLAQLQTLDRTGNQLTQLPERIGDLVQLQTLNLDRNQLTQLPERIGDLAQLERLFLTGNQLTQLPERIGDLTQLERLDIDENQLAELPESLKKLKSLEELYLHENALLGIPSEILGATWREIGDGEKQAAKANDILDYYFKVRGGKRPLNEAKLILVGRGAVGKTSLVNQLVHNRFDGSEKKTEGIKITEWNIQLHKKEKVRLNVWDFGGQEIMHSTHQFFFTKRSLYLLVLNGREGGEDADAEYWLKLIESFGDESPVIIVLNKIKDHPFDLNRLALQQKFPVIRDFIKTDCEKGFGISKLRKAIEIETDRLEHLRDAFPASWFSIKDKLSNIKKNFLSFEEYRKQCARLGEKDNTAQSALAGYLHNLGIALNYKDDLRLQDTHVLNPHWVTNGIYKILNSESLEKKKGEIHLQDLRRILDARKYPSNMHRFIFDLMKKFELCFTFPDDDCHYLIPELLDKQQPKEAESFKPEECLNFQYHYPVLPEGLLPRFIVRTHWLSEGQFRWRTGVILQFEGNRALVKADVIDKKVYISITGQQIDSRRRLLAIIRSDFERIHRDIRNLQPEAMVPVPDYPDVVVSYKKLEIMEQKGIKQFTDVIGEDVIDLNVQDLLNGVDLEGTRRKEAKMEERKQAARLFYSYSHKDESFKNELETHLKLLHRQGLIEPWSDRNINAGEDWKQKIDENLERADIILLLVSSDFIASDYCYEKEMKRALERHEKKQALIIPVIVRNVDWQDAPFSKLQALPTDGKAVTLWNDKDSAWRNVSEGIKKIAKEINSKFVPKPEKV